MTTQPLNAFSVRETGDKPVWTQIGVAFQNKKGFTLLLDAMPASDLGQYKIVVLPPKPREEEPAAPAKKTYARSRS